LALSLSDNNHLNVVKDINVAVLSTCGLLLTLILGFVVPSLKDWATKAETSIAVSGFFMASIIATFNLYSLGKRKPTLPEDWLFGVMMFFLGAGLLCLALAIANIVPT